MPYRIVYFLEIFKASIQFSTRFLKFTPINECFQIKDVIICSAAFSKANSRDLYKLFIHTLRQVIWLKQFVSILHRQLRTHIGRKLSELDEPPFLCSGVINI